ncbi:MAG TPA: molybdenum cofactor biosynthesis protein MoaE [Thermoplasmata archaeon]|nr:molybdenum cofactor biosynthesis protein MoaE [Thermoplasmata archaeon]
MIAIQRSRIDVASVVDGVRRDDAGAVVVFLGSVRADAGVRALEYEVYVPMAEKAFAALVEGAKSKFEVLEMSIVHRVGRVPVGEDSVVIACSAAHRGAAFAACSWAMDEVKRIVPIWKTESERGPDRPRPRRRLGTRKKD